MADTSTRVMFTAAGDLVVLGWGYESIGSTCGRHRHVRLRAPAPAEVDVRGEQFLAATRPSADNDGQSHGCPCQCFPARGRADGGLEFFLGDPARQPYSSSCATRTTGLGLTRDRGIVDVASGSCNRISLHLIQWFGLVRGAKRPKCAAYFTPESSGRERQRKSYARTCRST